MIPRAYVTRLYGYAAYYQADDYPEGYEADVGLLLLFNYAAVALGLLLVAHSRGLLMRRPLEVDAEYGGLHALYKHDDAGHAEEVGQRVGDGDVALQRRGRRLVEAQGGDGVARRAYDGGLRERAREYARGGAGVEAAGLAQPDGQPRPHDHEEQAEPDDAHAGVPEALDEGRAGLIAYREHAEHEEQHLRRAAD